MILKLLGAIFSFIWNILYSIRWVILVLLAIGLPAYIYLAFYERVRV